MLQAGGASWLHDPQERADTGENPNDSEVSKAGHWWLLVAGGLARPAPDRVQPALCGRYAGNLRRGDLRSLVVGRGAYAYRVAPYAIRGQIARPSSVHGPEYKPLQPLLVLAVRVCCWWLPEGLGHRRLRPGAVLLACKPSVDEFEHPAPGLAVRLIGKAPNAHRP